MRLNIFFVFVITSIIISCKSQKETVLVEIPTLSFSHIYEPDSIYRYNEKFGSKHSEIAESYKHRAEDIRAENIKKSIYYSKRAVSLQPSRENYNYLAGILNEAKEYKELLQLYELLARRSYMHKLIIAANEEYLFDKPDEDIYYEYMAMYVINQQFLSGVLIDEANDLGFNVRKLKEKLLADERLNLIPETETYKNILLQFMTNDEIAEYVKSEENFRNLLSSIKDTTNVFEIDENLVHSFNYARDDDYEYDEEYYDHRSISDFFVHYLKERQDNPDNWVNFNIRHRIKINDSITALVYSVDTSEAACPVEMRHIYHRVATYGKKGNLIASEILATQAGEKLSTVKFVDNMFVINDFNRTWKKPYVKSDYDNYLIRTEKTGQRSFEISSDGKISQVSSTNTATVNLQ